jgi:outer membrane protein insertion porin family
LQITPPYSLFKKSKWWELPAVVEEDDSGNKLPDSEIAKLKTDKARQELSEKYKWIEYHKWKFRFSSFNSLAGNLVLNTKVEFGYISFFNRDIGFSPFEAFQVGGDGLSGYNLYGTEVIGLRGYDDNGGYSGQRGSLTPDRGGNVYEKVTFELRYPLSLNPNATFYVLTFVEAGNAWYSVKDFSPFELRRSAGVGVRFFSALIGMLGVDWGYGFDEIPNRPGSNGSQFAFVIGQQF